jgi:hypothetical protein
MLAFMLASNFSYRVAAGEVDWSMDGLSWGEQSR